MGVKRLTGSPAAIILSITKIVGKSYTCNNKGTLTVAPNWGASAHQKFHHVDVLAAGKQWQVSNVIKQITMLKINSKMKKKHFLCLKEVSISNKGTRVQRNYLNCHSDQTFFGY